MHCGASLPTTARTTSSLRARPAQRQTTSYATTGWISATRIPGGSSRLQRLDLGGPSTLAENHAGGLDARGRPGAKVRRDLDESTHGPEDRDLHEPERLVVGGRLPFSKGLHEVRAALPPTQSARCDSRLRGRRRGGRPRNQRLECAPFLRAQSVRLRG